MEPTPDDQAERVRPLINSILERFNAEQITSKEAGWVILGLSHRLMTVLEQDPEERQAFILQFINLVNQYLAGELQSD